MDAQDRCLFARQPHSHDREALAKQQAAARYQKLTEEGKTPQAQKDLARLALIRKQREEAAARKAEDAAAKESKRQESLNAGKGIIGKSLGKKGQGSNERADERKNQKSYNFSTDGSKSSPHP